jgi:type IV pilus modification protein PilV
MKSHWHVVEGNCDRNRRQPIFQDSLPTQGSAGSTLAEVLVAVVIASIGMLTVTNLLINGLQLLGDNRHQQHAMGLAADLAEIIGHTPAAHWPAITGSAAHGCEHSVCNPRDFAEHSLLRWHERIGQLLPEGRGRLEVEAGGDQAVAHIIVQWATTGSGTASYQRQVALLDEHFSH